MRSPHVVRVVVAAAAVAGVLAAACGSKSSPSAPSSTASSAAPAPMPSSSGSARISGTVLGGVSAASVRATAATPITIKIVGTNITATVDPSGKFVLVNVPSGDVQLQITSGSGTATVDVGEVNEAEDIDITIHVSGSNGSIDDQENDDADNTVEIEGRVTSVTGTTTGSLVVRGKTVMVDANTTIRHGNTTLKLSDIKIGDRVHVKATKSGTTLTATEIMVQTSNGNPNPGNDNGNNDNQGNGGTGGSGHD